MTTGLYQGINCHRDVNLFTNDRSKTKVPKYTPFSDTNETPQMTTAPWWSTSTLTTYDMGLSLEGLFTSFPLS